MKAAAKKDYELGNGGSPRVSMSELKKKRIEWGF